TRHPLQPNAGVGAAPIAITEHTLTAFARACAKGGRGRIAPRRRPRALSDPAVEDAPPMARLTLDFPEQLYCYSTHLTVRITDINGANHLANDSMISMISE